MDGFLDTAILIDIYRGYQPAQQWLQNNQNKTYALSPIVRLEAMEGSQNKQQLTKIKKLLDSFPIATYQNHDLLWAMQQLETYHLSHNVGMMDCLIAAPSYSQQLPLLTRNLKHFKPLLNNLAQRPY